MAFPTVRDVQNKEFTTSVTDWTANFPATVNAGELLLLLAAGGANGVSFSGITGFTYITDLTVGIHGNLAVYGKIATGTEGGGTQPVTASTGCRGLVRIYAIQDWSGTIGDIVAANGTPDATLNPDPAQVTATTGAGDNLFIAMMIKDLAISVSAYPYPDNNYAYYAGGSGGIGFAFCSDELTTAASDPGTFTVAVANWSGPITLVIPPAAAAITPQISSVNSDTPIPNGATGIAVTGANLDDVTSIFLRDTNGTIADEAQLNFVDSTPEAATFDMVRGGFGYGTGIGRQYELVVTDGTNESAIPIELEPEAGRDYEVLTSIRGTVAERIQASPSLEIDDIVVFSTDTDTEVVSADGSVQRTGALPDNLTDVEIWSAGDWSASTATVPLQADGASSGTFIGNIPNQTSDVGLPEMLDAAPEFAGSFTNSRITGTVPASVTIDAAGVLSINAVDGDIGVYSGLTIDRFDGTSWIASNTFSITIEEAVLEATVSVIVSDNTELYPSENVEIAIIDPDSLTWIPVNTDPGTALIKHIMPGETAGVNRLMAVRDPDDVEGDAYGIVYKAIIRRSS